MTVFTVEIDARLQWVVGATCIFAFDHGDSGDGSRNDVRPIWAKRYWEKRDRVAEL